MGHAIKVGAVMRLLGTGREHPVVARRYRSVLATQHALDAGREWTWSPQPAGDEIAALLLPAVPLRILCDDGAVRDLPIEKICFLHPHRSAKITAAASGTVMCAWVPWSTLDEIESGVRAPGELIGKSDLGRGLYAFLTALLTQQSDPTPYTDYLVERLIAEMVFGVLVEAAPRAAVEGRGVQGIDRARSLMLMRRAEPDFTVAVLAREMHVSTRQLQRLFAAQGSAPADELRGMRVALARELMNDADFAPLGIEEIAVHSGFHSAAGLRRAFSLAGLPTSRMVRRGARG